MDLRKFVILQQERLRLNKNKKHMLKNCLRKNLGSSFFVQS